MASKGIEVTYTVSTHEGELAKTLDALEKHLATEHHSLGFVPSEQILLFDEKRMRLLEGTGLEGLKEVAKISLTYSDSSVTINAVVTNKKQADAAVNAALALQMEMFA